MVWRTKSFFARAKALPIVPKVEDSSSAHQLIVPLFHCSILVGAPYIVELAPLFSLGILRPLV